MYTISYTIYKITIKLYLILLSLYAAICMYLYVLSIIVIHSDYIWKKKLDYNMNL